MSDRCAGGVFASASKRASFRAVREALLRPGLRGLIDGSKLVP